MIATSEDFVNLSGAELGHVLELRLCVDAALTEAKLTVLPVSAGVEVTRLGEHERMVPASRDGNERLRDQVLHKFWSVYVLTRSVAELAMLAESEGVELTVRGQDHAVVAASFDLFDVALILQRHRSFIIAILGTEALFIERQTELGRAEHVVLLVISALAVLAASPGEELVVIGHGKGVIASCAYLGHSVGCEIGDLLRLLHVLEMAVAELAFVVGLTAATPRKDAAHLVQGY